MPLSPLSILAGLLGCLMGFLYAVSGFSDPGKVDSLAENPRVKNLVWLLGGAAAVFFVDWKVMSPEALDPAEKGRLVAAYGVFAVTTAVVVLAGMSLSILLDVAAAGRRDTALSGRAVDLVQEYLAYGFRAYRVRREDLEFPAASGLSAEDALAESGAVLSTLVEATTGERARLDAKRREELIDRTLLAIEDTVKLFAAGAANLRLESNYMALVSPERVGDVPVLFAHDRASAEGGVLVLRRYREHPADPIHLPVPARGQGERILPGAPSAAYEGVACILNTRRPVFKSGVAQSIRGEVAAYFSSASYESVLSIPLQYERSVVGIANVESNLVDLVGKGPDMIGKIRLAMRPYGVILGELVSREDS